MLLANPRIRQGLLARVAHSTWDLAAPVLRLTRDAVILRLLRQGLTILGSCVPGGSVSEIDVQIVNTAARRTSNLPKSARIESLRFPSGTHSHLNLL